MTKSTRRVQAEVFSQVEKKPDSGRPEGGVKSVNARDLTVKEELAGSGTTTPTTANEIRGQPLS
jgi:hypothetical protein